MKIRTVLLGVLCSIGVSQSMSAQTYAIDAGHSNVQVNVERFGVVDVVGRFRDVIGMITYNKEDLTKIKAHAIVRVNSYDANNLGGEQSIKSKAFLDAAQYPEISFSGNSAKVSDGKIYLSGDLTIHGVTQQIVLPLIIKGPMLDIPTKKQSIALNGTIVINRQDYGLSFDRKLPNGTAIVANEVKITLNLLALEE